MEILGSIIVALISLAGVIITNIASNRKVEQQIITNQAVTDQKIQTLTEEVRRHNNFASRIPVLEEKVKNLEDDVKEMKKK